MCYHAQFDRSSLKSIVIDKGEPQNWGALGTRPHLDRAGLADPLKQALPVRYIKFGSSASKGVRRNRQAQRSPKLGSAGAPPPCGGVWLTP